MTDLRGSMRFLEGRVASIKEGADIAKILLLFWGGATVVLGLFGFRTISDLSSKTEEMVESKYRDYFRGEEGLFQDYRQLLDKTVKLNKDFEDVNRKYLDRVAGLQVIDVAASDFDLAGQLQRFSTESENRKRQGKNVNDLDPDYSGTLLEDTWRARVLGMLANIARALEGRGKEQFEATMVFNAAQLARMLDAQELASKLATAAESMLPLPSHRAVAHVLRIQTSSDTARRHQEFEKLMQLVVEISADHPHIVLQEAWNAAQHLARYRDFLAAIEELEAQSRATAGLDEDSPAPVASYVYLMKAQTLLREGKPTCVAQARQAMTHAAALFRQESAASLWYDRSIEMASVIESILAESEDMDLEKKAGSIPPSELGMPDFDELIEGIFVDLSEAQTPGGVMRIGSRVRVTEPEDLRSGPGWVEGMDSLAETPMTVQRIRRIGDEVIFDVLENKMKWSPAWVVEIAPPSQEEPRD